MARRRPAVTVTRKPALPLLHPSHSHPAAVTATAIIFLFLAEFFAIAMPEPRLEYFNAYGRAEIIRWILTVAGEDFEDYRYAKAGGDDPSRTWAANKPNTPFGQSPVLRMDGKSYCQSMAIARYFANKYGMAGETPEEKALVDQVVDCCLDLSGPRAVAWKEADPDKKAEIIKKFTDEQLPKWLGYFNRMLKENPRKSGWFVGDKMTWADMFFAFNTTASGMSPIGVTVDWSEYPALETLTQRVLALPELAKWINERPKTRF